jgi:hypothetical protein
MDPLCDEVRATQGVSARKKDIIRKVTRFDYRTVNIGGDHTCEKGVFGGGGVKKKWNNSASNASKVRSRWGGE